MTRKRTQRTPEAAQPTVTVACPQGHTLATVENDGAGYLVEVRHYAVGDLSPTAARRYEIKQGSGGSFRLSLELGAAGVHEVACAGCGRDDFELSPRELLTALHEGRRRVVLPPSGL